LRLLIDLIREMRPRFLTLSQAHRRMNHARGATRMVGRLGAGIHSRSRGFPMHADPAPAHQALPAWSAVYALTLCVSTLIASEFLPVSLLTPLARDLPEAGHGRPGDCRVRRLCGGHSLGVARIAARLDRRHLLLGLVALMGLSGGWSPVPGISPC
jgi:hypothetical protein